VGKIPTSEQPEPEQPEPEPPPRVAAEVRPSFLRLSIRCNFYNVLSLSSSELIIFISSLGRHRHVGETQRVGITIFGIFAVFGKLCKVITDDLLGPSPAGYNTVGRGRGPSFGGLPLVFLILTTKVGDILATNCLALLKNLWLGLTKR